MELLKAKVQTLEERILAIEKGKSGSGLNEQHDVTTNLAEKVNFC